MRRALQILATAVLAGCGSATSTTGGPNGPTPQPGPSNPSLPAPAGGGVLYSAVRDAGYALERHDSLTIQLPGGATQQQLIDRTAYLRVAIAPDTAGYVATIVLDSIQAAVGGVPAVPDSVIPARGTRWTASLTREGRLSALKADRSTTLGDQLGSNLRSLFPSLPPGGVKAGMEWTDTTEVPIRADAFDATERSLTSYRATESDDPRAKKAIKLESTGSYQRRGKGTQYDQQLEMTASGTRTAVHYMNPDGTLASARGSDAGDLTITIPAVGQTVPVKQAGTFSIILLRPPKR
ncbi:MAG: hypothetical protein QOK27_1884 [Gemmatimonadales bacterium]|nr:hypothetical protein [Gemmatimonadales bacterium]